MNVQNRMLPQFSEQIMTTTDSVNDIWQFHCKQYMYWPQIEIPKSKTNITWSTLDSSSFNVNIYLHVQLVKIH